MIVNIYINIKLYKLFYPRYHMALEDNKHYKFFLKHRKVISLIEGLCIIILISGLWIMYFDSKELQEEISENCGWGEEDYECFCQKSEAIAMKNELMGVDNVIVVEEDYGIR